jgi:non-specific serine/threonine protein kinase
MALPYLVKHIYSYGTEEVIRRGKKIFALKNIELVKFDPLLGSIHCRVKDDGYSTYYKVTIENFTSPATLSLRCGCPYNLSEVCRHKAASLFFVQDLLDKNLLDYKPASYKTTHTLLRTKNLDLKMIRMLCSKTTFEKAEETLKSNRPHIIESANEKVVAEIEEKGKTLHVIVQKNEERFFDTSCDCLSETEYPLCIHKTVLLLQLFQLKGADYFETIRNWDREKNKLLALYGYTLDDYIEDKFEFIYHDGKPFLKVLDDKIQKLDAGSNTATTVFKRPLNKSNDWDIEDGDAIKEDVVEEVKIRFGLVLQHLDNEYPHIGFNVVKGDVNQEGTAFVGKVEKIDLAKFVAPSYVKEEDKNLLQLVRKLQTAEMSKFLNKNSPFQGIWDTIVHSDEASLPDETKELIQEYMQPKLEKLWKDLSEHAFNFFLPHNKSFTTANLQKAELVFNAIQPCFRVERENDRYIVYAQIQLPEGKVALEDNHAKSHYVFQSNHQFFTWKTRADLSWVEKFMPKGFHEVNLDQWPDYLKDTLLPLSKLYKVALDNVSQEKLKGVKPQLQILLKENGDYLFFEPLFLYKDMVVTKDDGPSVIQQKEDKIIILERDLAAERQLMTVIEQLHSGFVRPNEGSVLALKGAEVLKNNWFFLFVDTLREKQIPLFGSEHLKQFKFNTAKPSTRLYISSNTDWFDAKVEISFGDQKVSVQDIKTMLSNKQQYVPLKDGSLGVLPEQWLNKYSLLFKVGEGKADNLKLSKYHFSILDELYDQRDEEEIIFQLEGKYEKIRERYSIADVPPPSHLTPILRPYQISGFQWLNYLHDVQWGGILADDMGLGKTIQTLSFLQHLKEKNGKLVALVVCPTTLLYNWQNELKKFTPSLTFQIHHGGTRNKSQLFKGDTEVIITTYGTLRSDIKMFAEVNFDYVILDESQAIKNPSSKVTKAACLLKATNKLCLSGTPLQNNTFDIYAQMNFLNPGMLGSIEYFKHNFSMPIDKFDEKEQKEHLRKFVFPFILRRTKEQVAKDLPEKQEMVLYCEMGTAQRKIYEAYRNDYRDKLIGMVEEKGIQKSQLSILQGLMKLRQICDSPAILKDEDYPNESVKLDELTREIAENIQGHKALVFSQFLGMLALIKEQLTKLGIDYEYFDGSSTIQERERAIERFQNDPKCSVFLISLKAGGVGLNLTAADYVYIVDPWWNPAVEQQAIDRTHRIGQTKNIFAYRMICNDTVEDKILKLQDRKRSLAKELISDEDGFVKSLSKDDIAYLFS